MKATILLGGNMGNRLAYLNFACFHVEKDLGVIEKKSAIYETAPWGNKSNKPYLNQVIQLNTDLSPSDLLETLLIIEKKAGRVRETKWGNRTLDLDILFLEKTIVKEKNLNVPHPEIANRNFVLQPLMDLDPNFEHPTLGKSIKVLLQNSPDKLMVKKYINKRV